jgi:hypothetical protein
MKIRFHYMLSFFCTCMLLAGGATAQDNPGTYMTAISNAHTDMNQKYMAYMSAVAHGRRARKVEKLRQQTLSSIMDSKYNTTSIGNYKGDNSLRQASVDYIQLCYNVFNEDYNKIVNMEEIAEQSIDKMEAYILLQEKTNEKLGQAADRMSKASKEFAAKYNVQLISSKDELGEKMEKAGQLNHYTNQIFIIFFKCNFQDNQLVSNMNNNKVNDIEQSRTALLKYANEGLEALKPLRTFDGDAQLSNACRKVLENYKKSAETTVPQLLDFYLKKDNFEKMKKNMDSKSNHTKEEVDAYNAAVKEINAASAKFNQLNTNANNSRSQLLEEWENAQKAFGDAHMPHYK